MHALAADLLAVRPAAKLDLRPAGIVDLRQVERVRGLDDVLQLQFAGPKLAVCNQESELVGPRAKHATSDIPPGIIGGVPAECRFAVKKQNPACCDFFGRQAGPVRILVVSQSGAGECEQKKKGEQTLHGSSFRSEESLIRLRHFPQGSGESKRRTVSWRAVGLDLSREALSKLPEVWYEIVERLLPMERAKRLIPPEDRLEAIRTEPKRTGRPWLVGEATEVARGQNRSVELLKQAASALGRAAADIFTDPAVNVWEDAEAVYVDAELPGLDFKDLEIYVTGGNQLTIKGERKRGQTEKT